MTLDLLLQKEKVVDLNVLDVLDLAGDMQLERCRLVLRVKVSELFLPELDASEVLQEIKVKVFACLSRQFSAVCARDF